MHKKILGQSLYKRAKKVILGGNMLLSKRPEMFLPDKWPSYYRKSKGIYVTDLNNKKYIDMICAVGTNILGYANDKIDIDVNESLLRSLSISRTKLGIRVFYFFRNENSYRVLDQLF